MDFKIKTMKYGFFVHFVFGGHKVITINSDGSEPLDIESFADAFDEKSFANDLEKMGVEYIIFTVAHFNQNFLFPCEAVMKWGLDSHCCKRDLIGDMIKAVKAKGIDVILYTHPRDGHDFTLEDQKKTGWNKTDNSINSSGADPVFETFDFKKWNDFINDCYSEIVFKYGKDIIGLYIDEGSWRADSYRVVDYERLRKTIKNNNPHLVMIQNYYGNKYSCDISDKEYSYWGEFEKNDGSKWPCYKMPVGTVMGSQFFATVKKGENVVRFTPEDIFRYTVLEAGANTDGGGVQWSAGPYADGGWETGVLETMEKVGNMINAVAPSIKNTIPSPSFITKEGETIENLKWGVATRSFDNKTEYIHILKQIDNGRIILGKAADNAEFSEAFVLNKKLPLNVSIQNANGILSLIFDGEQDTNDTVIGLKLK